MRVTEDLIHKCHELEFRTLSDYDIDRTKYLLLDYLGVAARGSLNESSRSVQNLVTQLDVTGSGAVVIGTDIRVGPSYAALANGVAAHALELDDVVNEASLHPAAPIMSTALAVSHLAGCSGKDLIEAVVTGYEVTVRLGIALNPSAHYAHGFHPTGTCGAMGAAVTAAKLMKLDNESMLNAIGIAGSQASGSMEFLAEGSYTKRFHPGWAAHSGIMAALLAREGFTGPGTIIEGKSGFLHSHSSHPDVSRVLQDWAHPYQVMKTSIKPHACCRYKQGPIDCILKIMNRDGLKTSDITRITVGVLRAGFPLVVEPEEAKCNPKNIVDAQFSMPFGAAVAAIFGKASVDEYTHENIRSPGVKRVMEKVHCVADEKLEKEFPKKWPAFAEILTKRGKTYSARIVYPKGDPENPLTWQELIEKFSNLASPIYSEEKINQIIDAISTLEKERSLDRLGELLLRGGD
ncbi:MAG: MmgE/PrpD family protein [Candidatus Hydrogenedentota bacterium]|nr:MAG: MmgE/PrpD family protein [Candidatus Hydrogenedentota bacterium]